MSVKHYIENTCDACGVVDRQIFKSHSIDIPLGWERITMEVNLNGNEYHLNYKKFLCPGCADRVDDEVCK